MSEKSRIICRHCGAVNEVELPDPEETKEWLGCILPKGFEWSLPAGKITPIAGPAIYVDAFGNHLSWLEYLTKYNIDPEIAYQNMRSVKGNYVSKKGSYGRRP